MVDLPEENPYGHTKKLRFFLRQLDVCLAERSTPINLLDFGCGNGSAVSRYLIREGVQYYGVDFHTPSLEYARQHFGGKHAVFMEELPEGVVFDVVIYSDVLEHLDDPLSVLREHYARLRDRGLIIGAVPNGYGPFENEKRLDRWLRLSKMLGAAGRVRRLLMRILRRSVERRPMPPYNNDSSHVQFFTKRSLCRLLDLAGFELECFEHGAFAGAPFSERLIFRGKQVIEWNVRVADRLPHWAVSTWYFTARKK